jgi:hypothetical protein
VMGRETSDALPDDVYRFMKSVTMQRKPSETKMISVAKHREWQIAALQG